jgi:hypothetical protein
MSGIDPIISFFQNNEELRLNLLSNFSPLELKTLAFVSKLFKTWADDPKVWKSLATKSNIEPKFDDNVKKIMVELNIRRLVPNYFDYKFFNKTCCAITSKGYLTILNSNGKTSRIGSGRDHSQIEFNISSIESHGDQFFINKQWMGTSTRCQYISVCCFNPKKEKSLKSILEGVYVDGFLFMTDRIVTWNSGPENAYSPHLAIYDFDGKCLAIINISKYWDKIKVMAHNNTIYVGNYYPLGGYPVSTTDSYIFDKDGNPQKCKHPAQYVEVLKDPKI